MRTGTFALLVVLAGTLLIAGGAARSKPLALVVGISSYKSSQFAGLDYATRDAAELADLLKSHCGVSAEDLWLMLNEDATKAGIERAFAELTRRGGAGDTVFVYFAGHGSYVADLDGDEADSDGLDEILLPYDALPGREDTYLIDDFLGYLISRLDSGAIAIVLDACYSGGQGRSANAMGLSVRGAADSVSRDIFTDPRARPGRAILAACGSGGVAYENALLQHGVFTYYLLDGIRGSADTDRDGTIQLDELAQYVIESVRTWSAEHGLVQTPLYENPSGNTILIVPYGLASPEPPQRVSLPSVQVNGAVAESIGGMRLVAAAALIGDGLGATVAVEFGRRFPVRLSASYSGEPSPVAKGELSVFALLPIYGLVPYVGASLGVQAVLPGTDSSLTAATIALVGGAHVPLTGSLSLFGQISLGRGFYRFYDSVEGFDAPVITVGLCLNLP